MGSNRKKPKAYLEDRLYIQSKYVKSRHLKAFTYKFTERAFDEMFGEYVNVEREYLSYKETKHHGKKYFAFNCGDMDKINKVFGKDFRIRDRRACPKLGVKLKMKATLRPEQQAAVDFWLKKKGFGIIFAPVRWGKTYASGALVVNLGTTALILMDKIHLCNQWIRDLRDGKTRNGKFTPPITNIKEIEEKTGKKLIGLFKKKGKGKYESFPITVSTFQSMWSAEKRCKWITKHRDKFGFIWTDECHHSPAYTYSQAITRFAAKHKGGTTGSVKRRDNKEVLMHDIIGPITAQGTTEQLPCKVVRHMTDYTVNPRLPWSHMVSSVVKNDELNEDVSRLVAKEARKGRFVLVHTERQEHTRVLKEKIQEFDPHLVVEVMHGGIGVDERDKIIDRMNSGDVNVIIGARVMQEGITFDRADTLHIGFSPVTSPELIKQISGRVRTPFEGKRTPKIHDWRLKGHGGLYASGKRRDQYWEERSWPVKTKYHTEGENDARDEASRVPKLCGNCKNFFKCKSKKGVRAKSEICRSYSEYPVRPREKLAIIMAYKSEIGLSGWFLKFCEDLTARQDTYWSNKQLVMLEKIYTDCLNHKAVTTREV